MAYCRLTLTVLPQSFSALNILKAQWAADQKTKVPRLNRLFKSLKGSIETRFYMGQLLSKRVFYIWPLACSMFQHRTQTSRFIFIYTVFTSQTDGSTKQQLDTACTQAPLIYRCRIWINNYTLGSSLI